MAVKTRPVADVEPVLRGSKVIAAAIVLSLDGAEPGLSLPQLRALAVIDAHGPMNLAAVADALGVNPSNASRTCDRLVAHSLLDRREDSADKRNVILTLTRDGRRALDRMMKHRRAVLEQVMARMSPADQELLSRSMTAFSMAADQLTEEGELLSDGEGHLMRWLG